MEWSKQSKTACYGGRVAKNPKILYNIIQQRQQPQKQQKGKPE